jgi:hypothetical protein
MTDPSVFPVLFPVSLGISPLFCWLFPVLPVIHGDSQHFIMTNNIFHFFSSLLGTLGNSNKTLYLLLGTSTGNLLGTKL